MTNTKIDVSNLYRMQSDRLFGDLLWLEKSLDVLSIERIREGVKTVIIRMVSRSKKMD